MKERLIVGLLIAAIGLVICFIFGCSKQTGCTVCEINCPLRTFDTTYCDGIKDYRDANGNGCAMFCK